MSTDETIGGIAHSLLNVGTTCYHCKQPAALEHIENGAVRACHVCPDRYVSRIIEYGKELKPREFREFVQGVTTGLGQAVEDADIRIASRYAWDLGLDRPADDLILKEAYWTQSYRRTKSDDPNRPALFLCTNRDSFFVQPLSSGERFCARCRR